MTEQDPQDPQAASEQPQPPEDQAQPTQTDQVAEPTGSPHPRRRRAAATITATALVGALAGGGVGYAAGYRWHGGDTKSAAGNRDVAGQGQVTVPGYGTFRWNEQGSGSGQMPTDPFSGSGQSPFGSNGMPDTGSGGGQMPGVRSNVNQTTAKGSQLTGMVRIQTSMKYSGAEAAGTGMVLTSDGEVVTNHHVVQGATSIKVKVMSTGKTYTAKVVGTDATDDVAVLQLNGASGLKTVTTDDDGVAVGDAVTAVGDAGGTVGHLSAAKGKVLSLDQSLSTEAEGASAGEKLSGMIKISSDVISGDSGGATYDADGKVVGMTTAASSGSNDIVGYAVPIAKVLSIAGDIEDGVTSSRLAYGQPAFLGIALTSGTTVSGSYAGTPAAKAGIHAGAKITAIGSTKVSTLKALRAAVAAHSVGDSVSVTWTDTTGASHTKTLTLIAGPIR